MTKSDVTTSLLPVENYDAIRDICEKEELNACEVKAAAGAAAFLSASVNAGPPDRPFAPPARRT